VAEEEEKVVEDVEEEVEAEEEVEEEEVAEEGRSNCSKVFLRPFNSTEPLDDDEEEEAEEEEEAFSFSSTDLKAC
jgi:hypothetical protein